MTDSTQGRLLYAGEIRKYVLGGNATFTIRYPAWNLHHTFKVRSGKLNRNENWSTKNADMSILFISAMEGSDNESEYKWIGTMRLHPDGHYVIDDKIQWNHSQSRQLMQRFRQFWTDIEHGCRVPRNIEFFHEGSCCICGRKLTNPESVASGIGPECASK